MEKLRSFVNTHVSRSTHYLLLFVAILALGASGKAFVQVYESELNDVDLTMANVAVIHIRREIKAPSPSTKVPSRSLAVSEKSADILLLQNFLIWKGLLNSDGATGYFGPATLEAVRNYQKSKNLEPAGIVGPQTRASWAKDVVKGL